MPMKERGGDVCVDKSRAEVHLARKVQIVDSFDGSTYCAQAQREHAVFFLDWDDTLIASTALYEMGLCPSIAKKKIEISSEIQLELREVEKIVVQILEKALTYGRVVIVTAANTGWVELSASIFMPSVLPYLHTRVKVISARSAFECSYPDSPSLWKIKAFAQEVFPLWEVMDRSCYLPRNIISIGDGPNEREALIYSKREAKDYSHGKSIQLLQAPTMQELRVQLELLLDNLDTLCHHNGDLDLQITLDMLDFYE